MMPAFADQYDVSYIGIGKGVRKKMRPHSNPTLKPSAEGGYKPPNCDAHGGASAAPGQEARLGAALRRAPRSGQAEFWALAAPATEEGAGR